MCHSKTESLHFYKYLCLKIEPEDVIRARRLLYLCRDLRTNKLSPQITSGSKGEGPNLKVSDLDVMYVNPAFVVYKSEKDAVRDDRRAVLVMDTKDTPPYKINCTLSKCTDESSVPNITLKQTQNLKLISQVKSLTIPFVTFKPQSSVIPLELKFDVRKNAIFFKSIPCAHFLRFLCWYRLQDLKSCYYCITQLFKTILEHYLLNGEIQDIGLISVGIACQMLGDRDKARKCFRFAAQSDEYNKTSAAFSLLDYGNALLYNVNSSTIARLQRVQNTAARLITRKRKFDSITPVLMQLHWLPVQYGSHFKLLLYVFKALHDKVPKYLEELIVPYAPIRTLRSENEGLITKPRDVRTKTYGERRFDRAGATLWNDLPIHLRKEQSLPRFKKGLKTHIFRLAYCDV
ncbi:unnamed protein product [Mytilus coruscus]|uniref:Uncharacterized protein n=1 Tax=Mytilus coruscus TaxID=42192 RepID=A0A6J8DYU1_MYTCO|nr:unnamed protein product [Mytilus coruscus]